MVDCVTSIKEIPHEELPTLENVVKEVITSRGRALQEIISDKGIVVKMSKKMKVAVLSSQIQDQTNGEGVKAKDWDKLMQNAQSTSSAMEIDPMNVDEEDDNTSHPPSVPIHHRSHQNWNLPDYDAELNSAPKRQNVLSNEMENEDMHSIAQPSHVPNQGANVDNEHIEKTEIVAEDLKDNVQDKEKENDETHSVNL